MQGIERLRTQLLPGVLPNDDVIRKYTIESLRQFESQILGGINDSKARRFQHYPKWSIVMKSCKAHYPEWYYAFENELPTAALVSSPSVLNEFLVEDLEHEHALIPGALNYGMSGIERIEFLKSSIIKAQKTMSSATLSVVYEMGFPDRHIELAILCNRMPLFQELMLSNPQLAYFSVELLESMNQHRDYAFDKFESKLKKGATSVMQALGFGTKSGNLEFLRRIPLLFLNRIERCNWTLAKWLFPTNEDKRRMDALKTILLNAQCPILPNHLVFAYTRANMTAALARDFWRFQEQEVLTRNLNAIEDLNSIVSDFVGEDLYRGYRMTDEIREKLSRVGSVRRVIELHNELIRILNLREERTAGLGACFANSSFWNMIKSRMDDVIPCPIRHLPNWVIPLDTPAKIKQAASGNAFCNCAYHTYMQEIYDGNYYLYLVNDERGSMNEQAMFGIRKVDEKWKPDQIFGPANYPASLVLKKKAYDWLMSGVYVEPEDEKEQIECEATLEVQDAPPTVYLPFQVNSPLLQHLDNFPAFCSALEALNIESSIIDNHLFNKDYWFRVIEHDQTIGLLRVSLRSEGPYAHMLIGHGGQALSEEWAIQVIDAISRYNQTEDGYYAGV